MKMLESFSHELKTPLNCSMLLLEVAREKLEKTMFQHYLSPVYNSNFLLLSIINDIEDFAQLETGNFHLNIDRFNLIEMLQ
jgi:signal transduction histidine kinase